MISRGFALKQINSKLSNST